MAFTNLRRPQHVGTGMQQCITKCLESGERSLGYSEVTMLNALHAEGYLHNVD